MDDKMNESKTILNLSTIPIKVMDSEYYTHWFPIEEINQIQNGKEKRKVNLKIVKNDKLLKNKSKSKSKEKKRISPLKRKDIKKA